MPVYTCIYVYTWHWTVYITHQWQLRELDTSFLLPMLDSKVWWVTTRVAGTEETEWSSSSQQTRTSNVCIKTVKYNGRTRDIPLLLKSHQTKTKTYIYIYLLDTWENLSEACEIICTLVQLYTYTSTCSTLVHTYDSVLENASTPFSLTLLLGRCCSLSQIKKKRECSLPSFTQSTSQLTRISH